MNSNSLVWFEWPLFLKTNIYLCSMLRPDRLRSRAGTGPSNTGLRASPLTRHLLFLFVCAHYFYLFDFYVTPSDNNLLCTRFILLVNRFSLYFIRCVNRLDVFSGHDIRLGADPGHNRALLIAGLSGSSVCVHLTHTHYKQTHLHCWHSHFTSPKYCQ